MMSIKTNRCRTALTFIISVMNKNMVYADVRSCKYVQLARTGNSLCHYDSSDSCVAYELYVVDIKYIYHSKGVTGNLGPPWLRPVNLTF